MRIAGSWVAHRFIQGEIGEIITMPIQLSRTRPLKPIERVESSKLNWKQRAFSVVPAVDASGSPLPQDPPLNAKGFWSKPDFKKAVEIDKNVKPEE